MRINSSIDSLKIVPLLLISLIIFCCSKDIITPPPQKRPMIGFNQNWSFLPVLSSHLLENIKMLKPEILRYPGGTLSHSWDWVKGIKTTGNSTPHPIKDIQSLANATNAKFVFVLDILNRTLDDQTLMLKSIQELGVSVDYIELGNELYAQDSVYISIFPTGNEYAEKVIQWAPKLREVFPQSKISALLQCRNSNSSNQRLNQWNELVAGKVQHVIDAYTYHIYIPIEGSYSERIQEFEKIKNSTATGNKELWITEYGNQNSSTNPSYLKSLDSLADYIESQSFITLAMNHLIVGNNMNKLTSDGAYFTPEGEMFLFRASKR